MTAELTTAEELSGELRIELSTGMSFGIVDGVPHLHPVNAMRVFRRNEKDRWVKALGGPIIATETSDAPTFADLLEAMARILRAEGVE